MVANARRDFASHIDVQRSSDQLLRRIREKTSALADPYSIESEAEAFVGEALECIEDLLEDITRLHATMTGLETQRDAIARSWPIQADLTEIDPTGWFVYMLWGDDQECPLYVEQSTNVLSRTSSHLTREKRPHVRRIMFLRCASFKEMDDLERQLIFEYRPPWNTRVTPLTEIVDPAGFAGPEMFT